MRSVLLFVIVAYSIFIAMLLVSSPALKGDLNFTMDDAYIYANYVCNAASGYFFEYNIGEKTGGITSLLWFLGWVPFFQAAKIGLEETYALHISGYVLAVFCMTGTLWVLFQFANRLYRSTWLSVLVCLFVGGDPQLLWGALSGLEIPLTTFFICLVLWAAWEVCDEKEIVVKIGRKTYSRKRIFEYLLVILSLFAFPCRPEMVICIFGISLFLIVFNIRNRMRNDLPLKVVAATVVGFALTCGIYYSLTGYALASSYYAKVKMYLGYSKLGNAIIILSQFDPYEIFLYGLFICATLVHWRRKRELRLWLLPFLLIASFYFVKVLTVPGFAQEHRYISPFKPVLVLFGLAYGILLAKTVLVSIRAFDISIAYQKHILRGGVLLCFLIICIYIKIIVSPNYARWVYGRLEGGVTVGRWIRDNTNPQAIVASEPIGLIHLYSRRFTVDIVGLTTNGFAGHYPQWREIFPLMKERNADYLVYYPKWFARDGLQSLPPWLKRVATFNVEVGNSPPYPIGSTPIEVYQIDWKKYD